MRSSSAPTMGRPESTASPAEGLVRRPRRVHGAAAPRILASARSSSPPRIARGWSTRSTSELARELAERLDGYPGVDHRALLGGRRGCRPRASTPSCVSPLKRRVACLGRRAAPRPGRVPQRLRTRLVRPGLRRTRAKSSCPRRAGGSSRTSAAVIMRAAAATDRSAPAIRPFRFSLPVSTMASRFPTAPSTTDLAPLALGHFGVEPPASMRVRVRSGV